MAQKLNGKVAIVTAASKKIGAGIAKQLAAEGASADPVSNFLCGGFTEEGTP